MISEVNKKGFTLIELLVIIAIIGLLSSIAVFALNNARIKARDARRKVDIKQLASAIELYYDKYGNYPRNSGWCTQISNPTYTADFTSDLAEFMPAIPFDPQFSATYQDYFYRNIGDQAFYLYAELESVDRADDGFSGCARIGGVNNEYDLRYPAF